MGSSYTFIQDSKTGSAKVGTHLGNILHSCIHAVLYVTRCGTVCCPILGYIEHDTLCSFLCLLFSPPPHHRLIASSFPRLPVSPSPRQLDEQLSERTLESTRFQFELEKAQRALAQANATTSYEASYTNTNTNKPNTDSDKYAMDSSAHNDGHAEIKRGEKAAPLTVETHSAHSAHNQSSAAMSDDMFAELSASLEDAAVREQVKIMRADCVPNATFQPSLQPVVHDEYAYSCAV